MQSWLNGHTGKLVGIESGSNNNQLRTRHRVQNPRTDSQALCELPEKKTIWNLFFSSVGVNYNLIFRAFSGQNSETAAKATYR